TTSSSASGGNGGAGASAGPGSGGAGGAGGAPAKFGFTELDAADNFACAGFIHPSGVVCWTFESSPDPALVQGLPPDATSLSVGDTHRCVAAAESAYCWGDNSAGQLGAGPATETPRVVAGIGGKVSAVAAGGDISVARTDQGVWWWGGAGMTSAQFPG